MLVSFNYHPRRSVIEQFDPRARWIFSFAVLFSIILFWDLRFLLFFFGVVMFQYSLTRLSWPETRRAWTLVLILSTMMIVLNTIITGSGTIQEVVTGGTAILSWQIRIPLVNWTFSYTLTEERLWFALAQYLRIISIAALFLVIPFTMDPRLYGVTFKGLGFPDKLAYTMDLAFRFIPTFARDYQVTLDAQRARGFEIDKVSGGPFARIRKTAPLIIPITMNSILSGEDIANAMDLRCFGIMKRTWVEPLKYEWRDFALIAFSGVLLLTCLYIRFGLNIGNFWYP